jgi:hypothetical protein
MGDRNRVRIGLLYLPARLHRMAESIPWSGIDSWVSLKFKNTVFASQDSSWYTVQRPNLNTFIGLEGHHSLELIPWEELITSWN